MTRTENWYEREKTSWQRQDTTLCTAVTDSRNLKLTVTHAQPGNEPVDESNDFCGCCGRPHVLRIKPVRKIVPLTPDELVAVEGRLQALLAESRGGLDDGCGDDDGDTALANA